jgi:formate hydrogenlyase subunit 3/multisubunit Na+/H+ antiporter MnhD subunit
LQTAYLFRLINYMYGKKPKDDIRIKEPKLLLVPVFILIAAIIILGLYPEIVLRLIEPATRQLPIPLL